MIRRVVTLVALIVIPLLVGGLVLVQPDCAAAEPCDTSPKEKDIRHLLGRILTVTAIVGLVSTILVYREDKQSENQNS